MNAKSVIGVIIVAILVGVLYVVFEKNFTGETQLSNSETSSSKEMPKELATQQAAQETSLIKLPSPEPAGAPITESTDLMQEAQSLEMRDYSTFFQELKDTLK